VNPSTDKLITGLKIKYNNREVLMLASGLQLWTINILVALLTALNAIAWGFCIREIGDPQLSLSFILKLLFNRWFILAMTSALTASLLSYMVLRKMGVLVGRFFLSLGAIATILACTLVLGETLKIREWIGIAFIIVGIILIGRW